MAPVVPDFVIEVMSRGDELISTGNRMRSDWMANGVRLGWLLWPRRCKAWVYRAGVPEPEVVEGFEQKLSADPVVPGFSFDLRLLTQTGL